LSVIYYLINLKCYIKLKYIIYLLKLSMFLEDMVSKESIFHAADLRYLETFCLYTTKALAIVVPVSTNQLMIPYI